MEDSKRPPKAPICQPHVDSKVCHVIQQIVYEKFGNDSEISLDLEYLFADLEALFSTNENHFHLNLWGKEPVLDISM